MRETCVLMFGYTGEKDSDIKYFPESTSLSAHTNYIHYVMAKQFTDSRKDAILVHGLLYYTPKKMNWPIIH